MFCFATSVAVLGLQLNILSVSAEPASPDLEIPPELAPEYPHEIQDNIVEVNGTRYKLNDVTITPLLPGSMQVCGTTEEYPDRASIYHPFLWSYFIHCAFALIASFMSLYAPLPLMIILIGAVLVWPYSWIANDPIFAMQPGDRMWWTMLAKSIIVNIAPTAPVLLVKIANPSKSVRQRIGYWVYFILWANIAWTWLMPMPDLVMQVNAVCGAFLCMSLIVHNVALVKAGVTLVQMRGDVVYGYGTSLSWLVCYTIWNALFVADFAVGITLQDILFWSIMFHYYYHTDCDSGIEDYFLLARPVQLSTYIAVSDFLGLVPFFRDAHGIGLDLNRHAYFLFIALMNLIYSVYVLACDIQRCLQPNVLSRELLMKGIEDPFADEDSGEESDQSLE